jgi:hypothetical protein
MKDKNKLPTESAGVPLDNGESGNYQPQVDEISSQDGIQYIDSIEELKKVDEGPLVGDNAKDYEDMPEGDE